MTISEIIIFSLSTLMLLPTLASLTRWDKWWIRGFDFPRIQICSLIILLIAASLIFYDFLENWHYIITGLLVSSLIYQFVKIFPYTFFATKQVFKAKTDHPESSLSLLVSNVLMENKQYDKLIDLVRERRPDILLTLESDKSWEKQLEVLEDDYKYTIKVPQDDLYGMHLYSKLKLENTEVRNIVQENIPSIHGYIFLENGTKIRIHCLHPMPPSPGESETSTNRDAELLMLGRDIKLSEQILVFGDLNDVAWSRTTKLFLKMSGLLDPRRGRGFYNTFNAKHPLLRWPLDHVFHSKDFSLIELSRERYIGSDHFPIYIKLNHSSHLKDIQEEEPDADTDEKEWAQEKIEDARPLESSV